MALQCDCSEQERPLCGRFIEDLYEHFSASAGLFLAFREEPDKPVLIGTAGAGEEYFAQLESDEEPSFIDRVTARAPQWAGQASDLWPTWTGKAIVASVGAVVHDRDRPYANGCLVLVRPQDGDDFNDGDDKLLSLFAIQATSCVEQVDIMAQQRRLIKQQSLLANLGALLNSEQEQSIVHEKAIDAVRTLLECEASSLILVDSKSKKLQFAVATGRAGEALKRLELEPEEGIAGWVVKEGKKYRCNDLDVDERHSKRIDEQAGFDSENLVCVPLLYRGRVLGALQAVNSENGFTEVDEQLLELLAQHVATALENLRLYESLKESLVQLKNQQDALIQTEKLSAMGLLAAGVAHEVRSPLTAISGYAQLLKRQLPPDMPLAKKISIIERSVETINRIVNGLLDFSKKEETCWENVNVNDVVEDALLLSEHTLNRFKRVNVERNFTEDLPVVEADRRQLQQVFVNLILNGAEAMSGGGTLTIRTSLDRRDGVPDAESIHRVEIAFIDEGVGIPQINRDRVFEPFFTEGKKAGTGLGLSICKSIMKKHRGEITFDCPEEGGTIFYIYIPVLTSTREQRQ